MFAPDYAAQRVPMGPYEYMLYGRGPKFVARALGGTDQLITCKVPNSVGKMNTEVYTIIILPQLLPEMHARGVTLVQDRDSAHNSKDSIAWGEEHGQRRLRDGQLRISPVCQSRVAQQLRDRLLQ